MYGIDIGLYVSLVGPKEGLALRVASLRGGEEGRDVPGEAGLTIGLVDLLMLVDPSPSRRIANSGSEQFPRTSRAA